MTSIEFPSVVFSRPAAYNLETNIQQSNSSSGYWSSNGFTSLNQTPYLDAHTSGSRDDLLTPDTSRYIHADSGAFNAATKLPSWPNGFTIYTARFRQDNPIELPTAAPASQASIKLALSITMRSVQPAHPVVDVSLNFGTRNEIGIYASGLSEPDDPLPTPDWQTFVCNLAYDFSGGSFPIIDYQFPAFWDRLVQTASEGDMAVGLTFSGPQQMQLGTFDIAHVKLGGSIEYVGAAINPGTLTTRQRFGRA